MAAPSAPGGIAIQIDSQEWYRLSRDLKQFDPKLMTALRKRLRNAGNFAVDQIRKTLGMPSPDGGPDAGKYRDMLAAATKVSISFSQKQAGAKVVTSGRSLPENHRALLKVYTKDSFRHPVFGDDTDWVTQRGRPYFGAAFEKDLVRVAQQEINDALEEASNYLRR
jgi:hypothetical protein